MSSERMPGDWCAADVAKPRRAAATISPSISSALAIFAIVLSACATDAGRPDAAGPDAASAPDATVLDAEADGGVSRDASPIDGSPDAQVPVIGDHVRAVRTDGTRVEGELVALYDHRNWWEAEPVTTWAIFDPAGLNPFPNDTSLRFERSTELASMESDGPKTGVRYTEALRTAGIVWERPPLDGVSYVITGNESYHLEENGYGDFAWDLVVTDDRGVRFSGLGTVNEDYLVWDREVFLPTAGVVIEVVRDGQDNLPGAYPEGAINNLVGVAVSGSYAIYMLHFRQGSIPAEVEVGAALPAGTYLGRVGNAGVTLEPHLHMVMLWYDARSMRSWSVPSELHGVWIGTSPTEGTYQENAVPESGQWLWGP